MDHEYNDDLEISTSLKDAPPEIKDLAKRFPVGEEFNLTKHGETFRVFVLAYSYGEIVNVETGELKDPDSPYVFRIGVAPTVAKNKPKLAIAIMKFAQPKDLFPLPEAN